MHTNILALHARTRSHGQTPKQAYPALPVMTRRWSRCGRSVADPQQRLGAMANECLIKLSLCGTFPVTSPATFILVDHRPVVIGSSGGLAFQAYSGSGARLNGTAVRISGGAANVSANKGAENASGVYFTVHFQMHELGVHVLAIFLDGEQACCTQNAVFATVCNTEWRQVSNSPFLFAVTPAVCSDGTGLVADVDGACVCPQGTAALSASGSCFAIGSIAAAVLVPVAVIAAASWFARRFLRRAGAAEEDELRRAVLAVRERLWLTRREGFLMSTDSVPLWWRAGSVVLVQRTCLVCQPLPPSTPLPPSPPPPPLPPLPLPSSLSPSLPPSMHPSARPSVRPPHFTGPHLSLLLGRHCFVPFLVYVSPGLLPSFV